MTRIMLALSIGIGALYAECVSTGIASAIVASARSLVAVAALRFGIVL